MKRAIGIDLGTTYSVVAHVNEAGVPKVLENPQGSRLTPSVVYFDGPESVVVGQDAKNMGHIAPDRVVASIKRQMGRDFLLNFDGRTYRPEAISAVILRALAESTAADLGVSVSDLVAVVTVPAYFGVAEREATATATKIAGLECVDLVAEPVAAALAYGVSSGDRGTVLVFDLGGGTFDVTVVELAQAGPRVIAVDGSNELGGLNFDERLGELLQRRYVQATSDEDALEDEDFVLRLTAEAESVKRSLSNRETGAAVIEHNGQRSRIGISRAEFEDLTVDLVRECLTVVDRVVAAAGNLGAARPSQVVLVGGSTRMPMIRAALGRHLGVPVKIGDPDLVVAQGAAIHCRALTTRPIPQIGGSSAAPSTQRLLGSAPVRSVVPRALGIKLADSHDPSGERVFVNHLIKANTPLPVEGVAATFATILDGQATVRVELMEQAGAVAAPEVEFNRRVLDGELTGLPANLPGGSPIDMKLSVRLDGRIECVATERSTGRELVLESYVEGVSDGAETEAQRKVVSGLRMQG